MLLTSFTPQIIFHHFAPKHAVMWEYHTIAHTVTYITPVQLFGCFSKDIANAA